MKILYGVCGEGFGHSSRADTVSSLFADEHEILFASSKKAYAYLTSQKKKVIEINYSVKHAEMKENKIDYLATAWKNKDILKGYAFVPKLLKLIKKFNPDLVISDFEPLTAITARLSKTPLLSFDHQNIITRTKIDVPREYYLEYLVAKVIIENMVKNADHYLISSFFFPKIIKKKTTLVPTILRENIFSVKPENKNFTLVYQSCVQIERLLNILKKVPKEKFVVYDERKKEKRLGNITLKPQSKEGFIKDLASSKAVITTGGDNLISEAIYSKKPLLSTPISGHFEQTLSAYYMEKLGYGKYYETLDEVKIIGFLNNLDEYKKKLKKVEWNKNKVFVRKFRNITKNLITND
jgi:uncharacterized protein (TIGR00661 family)